MAKYVKSYSNYVLKTKHQTVNDGTVYERDFTTIGGRDSFTKGQIPIFRSGNFLLTTGRINNEYKKVSNGSYANNSEGSVWTGDILEEFNTDVKTSNDKKIEIKSDIHNLRDFAYYGSCSELIRGTINSLLQNFPGELYVPEEGVIMKYPSYEILPGEEDDPEMADYIRALKEDNAPIYREYTKDGKPLILVDNPFDIDMHSRKLPLDGNYNPYRYFADGGVNNFYAYREDDTKFENPYEIVINAVTYDFFNETTTETKTTNFSVDFESIPPCFNGGTFKLGTVNDANIVTEYNTTIDGYDPNVCLKPGDLLATISFYFVQATDTYVFNVDPTEIEIPQSGSKKIIHVDSSSRKEVANNGTPYIVYAYVGENNKILYFVEDEVGSTEEYRKHKFFRFRPKPEIIDNFFNNLDQFEKVLLNRNTSPKYTAAFDVIKEDDYGYYSSTEFFSFPTTYGGYNIGSNETVFNDYVDRLVEIGEFYDERFSDNLWRSMTHEAIKNFDWSFSREYSTGDEEPYVDGGSRIQKIIRLYAREFDEIKLFIDAVRNTSIISYNNINNLPDYFFSDKLEENGWEAINVIPLTMSEFFVGTEDTSVTFPLIEEMFYGEGDNKDKRVSSVSSNTITTYVYNSAENKYVVDNVMPLHRSFTTSYSGTKVSPYDLTENDKTVQGACPTFVSKIYSTNVEYSPNDVNTEFLKRLILNTNSIFKHKGTIDGIEMILGMFGMKSNRFDSKNYDYSIKEYTMFTRPLKDEYVESKKMFKYDWVNSTKLITYNTESYKKGIYESYQGLPVAYRDDGNNRYLYPNFQSGVEYDGHPYYQMNGGWLRKFPFSFDNNENVIMAKDAVINKVSQDSETYIVTNEPVRTDAEGNVDYIDNNLFTETVTNIKTVQTLSELFSSSIADHDGDICRVIDLSGRYAIIDGHLYPLYEDSEYFDAENGSGYSYFYATVENNSLSVGNSVFVDSVTVMNPNGYSNGNYLIQKIDLSDGYYNDRDIKIYVLKDKNGVYSTFIKSSDMTVGTFTVFEDGKYMEGDNYTNYFKLNNLSYYNELSVLGWQQLSNTDYEYYKLNSLRDENNGNNPHYGHMQYDNGHEYLTYFNRLFKYASDNDLFDSRQYINDSDVEMMHEASNIGFSDLINSDTCVKYYDDKLVEDTKVHFFGDLIREKDKSDCSKITKYTLGVKSGQDAYEWNLREIHPNWYDSNTFYGSIISGNDKFDTSKYGEIDGVTNQIINTKRVKIEFKIRSDLFSKDYLEEVKYIDSIVMPYLTTVLPSNIICDIIFKEY